MLHILPLVLEGLKGDAGGEFTLHVNLPLTTSPGDAALFVKREGEDHHDFWGKVYLAQFAEEVFVLNHKEQLKTPINDAIAKAVRAEMSSNRTQIGDLHEVGTLLVGMSRGCAEERLAESLMRLAGDVQAFEDTCQESMDLVEKAHVALRSNSETSVREAMARIEEAVELLGYRMTDYTPGK